MRRLVFLSLFLTIFATVPRTGYAWIYQITDNDFDDKYPSLHNGTIAWHGGQSQTAREIYRPVRLDF